MSSLAASSHGTGRQCLVTVALLALGGTAMAEAPGVPSAEHQAALRLYSQAKAVFVEGDYPLAMAQFEAAYRMLPRAVFLCNIAACQRHLFRYGEAIATYRRCIDEDSAITPAKRSEAEALIKSLGALLAEVLIQIVPEGARVRVDGRIVGRAPLPAITLLGGVHVLDVAAQDHEEAHREIVVVTGVPQQVSIALTPIPRTGKARITVTPQGARVTIDGQLAGVAPLDVELAPGGHQLAVAADGYLRYQGELTITRGAERVVPIELDRQPAGVVVAKRPLHKQWWVWTLAAVGAGVAATAIGVPLAAQSSGGPASLMEIRVR